MDTLENQKREWNRKKGITEKEHCRCGGDGENNRNNSRAKQECKDKLKNRHKEEDGATMKKFRGRRNEEHMIYAHSSTFLLNR